MANSIGTNVLPTFPLATDDNPTAMSNLLAYIQSIVTNYLTVKLGNANLSITDADILHGTRTLHLGPQQSISGAGTATAPTSANPYWSAGGAADSILTNIPLDLNRRITSVTVVGRSAGVTAWTWKLWKVNMSTGTVTQVGSTQISGTSAVIELKQIASLTETVAAHTYYFCEWISGAASNRFYGVEAQFDKVTTP